MVPSVKMEPAMPFPNLVTQAELSARPRDWPPSLPWAELALMLLMGSLLALG